MAQKKKINQSLVDYSSNLKKINDIEVDILQAKAEKIIDDPRQYALDFWESTIVKYVPSYRNAHKLGKELAKKNLNGQES